MHAHELNWAERLGRRVAMIGVTLPLALIGGLKFTAIEAEALKPLISSAPWLAWLYGVFGVVGTSRLLGTIELATALLLVASVRIPRAGIVGGALAALTFLVTSSLLFALPIWEPRSGGFPALNGLGSFLIKDITLLGVSIAVFGDGLARTAMAHAGGIAATGRPADPSHMEAPTLVRENSRSEGGTC